MRTARKWLILSHRYLGIALCLLLVMWFGSGIVMIYAGGMPSLTPEARRAHLPALDFSRVTLSPADAAARANLDAPGSATLLPVQGRPAYRFGGRAPVTVFADTGELLKPLTVAESRRVASAFLGVPESQLADVIHEEMPQFLDHIEEITRVFADYVARKQERALVDYDDLLLCWALMIEQPGLVSRDSELEKTEQRSPVYKNKNQKIV